MATRIARIAYTIFLVAGLALLPWWGAIVVMAFGMIYFNWYIEAVVAGFVLDALYGTTLLTSGVFTLATSVFVIFSGFARTRIRSHISL